MPECDKSGINYLIKNKKNSKYQNIIFVCRLCNFNTNYIKDIKSHSDICTGYTIIPDPLAEMIKAKQKIDEEKNTLLIKSNELESKLKSKDMSIINLQLRLQFEQMKNKIYTDIIQTHTNIKIEDIIKESNEEIHIFNFEQGNIPLVVHDFMSEKTQKYTINIPKEKPKRNKHIADRSEEVEIQKKAVELETIPSSDIIVEGDDCEDCDDNYKSDKSDKSEKGEDDKKKKKTYRTVKEYIKTSEKELGSKLQEDVARVDKQIDQIVYDNFDVSLKEITESLEKIFDTITKTRVYTVSLSSMKTIRKKLLGKLKLEEYKTLLLDHIKRLDTIFSQRNYSSKPFKMTH